MNDHPTPDPGVQIERHGQRRGFVIHDEGDGLHSLEIHLINDGELARLLRYAEQIASLRPLPPLLQRTLLTIEAMARRRQQLGSGGRRSAYPPETRAEYADRALKLKSEGKTWAQVAAHLSVGRSTLHRWALERPAGKI